MCSGCDLANAFSCWVVHLRTARWLDPMAILIIVRPESVQDDKSVYPH